MSAHLGVSAAAVQMLLTECELGGIDTHALQKILVPREGGFHDWRDYLSACDALVEQLGSQERFTELVQATITRALPHVLPLAPIFPRVADFAAFATQSMDAVAFLGVRYELVKLERSCLQVQLRAERGYELTPSLLAGVVGAYRAVSLPFSPEHSDVRVLHGHEYAQIEVRIPVAALRMDDEQKPRGPAEALRGILARQRQSLETEHALVQQLAILRDDNRRAEGRAVRARRAWDLTEREVEVLVRVCLGLTNREIALELGRAESTIELHVTRMLKKAGVSNRVTLVARYFQL